MTDATRTPRRSDGSTPIETLLRAWAQNESKKDLFPPQAGPNKYLIDLLLDAADLLDALPSESKDTEDAERWRCFRDCSLELRQEIVDRSGEEKHMLDHFIVKARCGL